MVSLQCPYCGVYSLFTPRTSFRDYGIYTCNHCNKAVLLIGVTDDKFSDQYPKRTPQLDKSIPIEIANDHVEAIKCFDVGAFKATVVMCRRALQGSVIEKGTTKDKLKDQINELCDKRIITEDIRDWGHEIRLTGNIGAHPDEDGLKGVTKEDAEQMMQFMERYLEYVYVLPAKVAEQRCKRKRQP